MTVNIYQVTDERVAVLTDTMAYDSDGGFACFVDKVEVLPQVELAVVFDNYAAVGVEWVRRLRACPPRGIDTLNEKAPDELTKLWEAIGDGHRTTVRAFGVSERDGVCRGFSYRSERGFESQPIPPDAVGISPVPTFVDYDVASLDGWIDLASRLRGDRPDGKVLIGGDLMLTVLAPGSTTVTRVHRFEDAIDRRELVA